MSAVFSSDGALSVLNARIHQLLRLKCEAYSTLNESDENHSVEDRLQEHFIQSVAVPPSAALLAPAALYLTAILECVFLVCSIVGLRLT